MTRMARDPDDELSVAGVASVDRALAVLTAFKRGDAPLSLAELARRSGLVKSTVMRVGISLEHAGLLKKLADGRYRLDAGILRLASIYQDQISLEDIVTPALQRLVETTEETASFYIRHGEHRLCLFRVDSPHRLRLHIRPGDMLPMDESSIAQVLRRFESGPPASSGGNFPIPLYTAGKRDPHISGLSTPVFGAGNTLVGALAISGPITRFTADKAKAIAADLIREACELTRTLGGSEQDIRPMTRNPDAA